MGNLIYDSKFKWYQNASLEVLVHNEMSLASMCHHFFQSFFANFSFFFLHFILWEHNLLHPLSSHIIHKGIGAFLGPADATSVTLHLIDLCMFAATFWENIFKRWTASVKNRCRKFIVSFIINSTPFVWCLSKTTERVERQKGSENYYFHFINTAQKLSTTTSSFHGVREVGKLHWPRFNRRKLSQFDLKGKLRCKVFVSNVNQNNNCIETQNIIEKKTHKSQY